MPATDRPQATFVARWVLLVAVIAGVFGMHVLTAGDGPGHGMLPMAAASDHHGHEVMPSPPDQVSAAGAPASGHEDMTGCILFLVVGGAALLLLALARSAVANGTGTGPAAHRPFDPRRRGPPGGRPRIALSVIRV